MDDYPSAIINRHLILLLPKQPVLDWLKQVDEHPLEISLAELRQEQDAFLLPEDVAQTPDEATRWVHRRWQMFFERFLFDWYVDDSYWPKKRTLKMFKEWFEVQYHSMVWDFAQTPITHTELD